MTESGLVRLARVALEVAEAVLPAYYRTKVSQHVFTQPQLLAVLCFICYEDRPCEDRGSAGRAWRVAEGSEHAQRRQTRLRSTAFCGGSMADLGVRLGRNRLAFTGFKSRLVGASCHRVAVDATELTPGVLSSFYIQRIPNRIGKLPPGAGGCEVAHRGRPARRTPQQASHFIKLIQHRGRLAHVALSPPIGIMW